ncbi:hypothetical protein FACS189454_07200 [Planctomycetales bacterium]|nr:hypothetical protein FACS189454_07200 [Planctomycetales bacterium]
MPLIAPGGLTVIPPDIDFEDVAYRADVPELLKNVPDAPDELKDDIRFKKEVWTKQIRHNREIWCLQFSFKPVRVIEVEIPNKEGKLDKKAVWYLVYNVKNLGKSKIDNGKVTSLGSYLASASPEDKTLTLPVADDKTAFDVPRTAALSVRELTGKFELTPGSGKEIIFQPQFVLTIHKLIRDAKAQNNPETGEIEYLTDETSVSYSDKQIPLALPQIIRREGMKSIPETSVSFPTKKIAAGQDYWGVATWTDIDPRINEFSVYVSGLTNAYQQIDKKNADGQYENTGKAGEGRVLKRKVLKTDWWRPGDQYTLSEAQIKFGARNEKVEKDIFDVKGDFNQDGRVDDAERKRFDVMFKEADTNEDGWISDFEKAEYHRIHQDWLKPSYGFSWEYL